MRQSMRRALVWQVVSLLLTLAGLILSALVIIGVFLSPPENSFANMRGADLILVATGMLLVSAGRLIGWKFGVGAGSLTGTMAGLRNRQPNQSRLEQLGYHMPADASESGEAGFVYEDDAVYVVCGECGAQNEDGFSYCRNCSAELRE